MYSKRPEFQLWAIEVRRAAAGAAAAAAAAAAAIVLTAPTAAAAAAAAAASISLPLLPLPPPLLLLLLLPLPLLLQLTFVAAHFCRLLLLLPQVKKIDIEAMPRSEEKEMFKEFMEEFNTASFPHK